MKEVTITLTPNNVNYPTVVEKTTDIKKAIYAVYHDSYDIKIISDWYEGYTGVLLVDAEKLVPIQLQTKKGTLTVNGTSGVAVIGTDRKPLPATFSLSYKDTPYAVSIEKEFHQTVVKQISINPTSPSASLTPVFVPLEGIWKKEIISTERIPYDTRELVDNTKPADYKTIDTIGSDGVKTFYIENEYINGKPTGRTRNESTAVTKQPIMEVVTVGKKDSIPRNPNIVSSGELLRLDNNMLGVQPEVDLKKEEGTFYETFTYSTGGQTTFNLNAQDLVAGETYLFSMDMRIPVGTDLSQLELSFNPDVKRVVPKPVANGKWQRVVLRYEQTSDNTSRSIPLTWTAPSNIVFDARRVKLEKETSNNILYGFPLPFKLKPEEASQVKIAIGKVPTPW